MEWNYNPLARMMANQIFKGLPKEKQAIIKKEIDEGKIDGDSSCLAKCIKLEKGD